MTPHDEPTHDDLTELDLTAAQAGDLTALLRGAAARVEVPAPAAPVRHSSRRQPTRWLAAAALVLVAAIGTGWWFSTGDGERVQSGPANPSTPSVTVAPHVLEQTGVWRLPEGLDDTRVVDANRTSAVGDLLFAFDDPDDPTRWIALGPYELRPSLPHEDVVRHPVTDGVALVDWSADGAEWTGYEVLVDNGMGTGDSPALTVIAQGLGRDQVLDLVRSTFPNRAALIEPDRLIAALAAIDLPDDLHASWDEADLVATFGEPGSESSTFTDLQVTLLDDAGGEIVVSLSDATASATAVQLSMEVTSAIMSTNRGDAVVYRSHPRPDLGDGVLEYTFGAAGDGPTERDGTILIVTRDGVMISATRAVLVSADDPEASPDAWPLTEAEQLRIINSLQSMNESEFRTELGRLGASHSDGTVIEDPVGPATTLPGD